MTCRPPVAEVGSEPGGDRANVRRRACGDAAAQGAPEPSAQAEDIHAPGVHGRTDRLGRPARPATSVVMREGSRARTGNYNDGCDPEHLVEFVIVSSPFNPELRAYYAEEAKEWLASLEV